MSILFYILATIGGIVVLAGLFVLFLSVIDWFLDQILTSFGYYDAFFKFMWHKKSIDLLVEANVGYSKRLSEFGDLTPAMALKLESQRDNAEAKLHLVLDQLEKQANAMVCLESTYNLLVENGRPKK